MANDYWQLKRNDNGARIELPQDMRWSDEFDWSRVAQAEPQRTLSGGLVIQQGVKLNGRPITLNGEGIWIDRDKLLTLRDWTDIPELEMTLQHYDGREFTVVFRLHDSWAANLAPVMFATPETGSDKYTATINLMTI
ncbi:hypothetical protein [Neisseria sp. S1]|uniref:hypothetical protein n=1 Tax=Neisseria sp. S1 TaxID=3318354 RepID=UPI003A8C40A9